MPSKYAVWFQSLKWTEVDYHGLRDSASLVLTTTGFVNGRWQFLTATESTPIDRSPKHLVQVITSGPPRLCQIWCKSVDEGFWATGWNITNFFKFIPFSSTHQQVRPVDGFSRWMAQTTRTRARVCLLGVSLIFLPVLWVKSPQTPIFGSSIGFFKQNGQNLESFIL